MSEESRDVSFVSNVADLVEIPGSLGKSLMVRVEDCTRKDGASLHLGYQFPFTMSEGFCRNTQFAVVGLVRAEIEQIRDTCQEYLGGYSYAELQRENDNLANRVTELQCRLEEAEGKELIAEETRDDKQTRQAEAVAAEERP